MALPTVLIAEDEADIRETLIVLLTEEGYPTLQARDGWQALSILRREPQPLVVLLDLALPRLTGLDILRIISRPRFQRLGRQRVFIVQTARALMDPSKVADILAQFEIPLIIKPFDIDQVLTAVAHAALRLKSSV
jgi:CheY-like chemotaxis protein